MFIFLMVVVTAALAGTAAFFSVYGLAELFRGIFWMVVIMGSALEAAKLMATSYLYRFWTQTNILLKAYLMCGILTLMAITSVGIFGMLSSGYQTDVLPLQQLNEQVNLLQQEKQRVLDRKTQIDTQISQLPSNYIRGRVQLMNQFKGEQQQVTQRLAELEQQLLELKQKQIHTQAHIGPITYIAKAFGAETDDATKYLIILIIFAFDPMAVALTLAVNITLRDRKNKKLLPEPIMVPTTVTTSNPEPIVNVPPASRNYVDEALKTLKQTDESIAEEPQPIIKPLEIQPIESPDELIDERKQQCDEIISESSHHVESPVEQPTEEPQREVELELVPIESEPLVVEPIQEPQIASEQINARIARNNIEWEKMIQSNNIQELFRIYSELKNKNSKDGNDVADIDAIERVLSKHGLLMYAK